MNGTHQLAIDECIDWILGSIDAKKMEYKYANGEGWEFLIFTGDDYYMDTRMLTKIERTTGMILVQLKCNDGKTEMWFGRKLKE